MVKGWARTRVGPVFSFSHLQPSDAMPDGPLRSLRETVRWTMFHSAKIAISENGQLIRESESLEPNMA